MTKLNLQGLKINVDSLKRAVGEIPTKNGPLPDLYLQISYDKSDGEILTDMHADCNSQTVYHDSNIITVGYYTRHIGAQKLIDDIVVAIDLDSKGRQITDDQQRIQDHNIARWCKQNGYPYDDNDIIKD